jgi:hypothetical protein
MSTAGLENLKILKRDLIDEVEYNEMVRFTW